MRITFILKEFPKTSETFIMSQAMGLLKLGHGIKIVSLRKPKGAALTSESPFSDRIIIPGLSKNYFLNLLKCFVIFYKNFTDPGFYSYAFKVKSLTGIMFYNIYKSDFIKNADFIIIHYGDLAYKFRFLWEKAGISVPLGVVFHGVDVARYLPALSNIERSKLFDIMTIGLPVSAFWKETLEKLGCPPEKLVVQHMGVDISIFPYRKKEVDLNPLRILTVCRLVEKKGIDTAISAIAEVNKKRPGTSIVFDIVGDGPEMQKLKKQSITLGISEKVFFHGALSHENISEILNISDVFILPSRKSVSGDMEGIPVSLMEAMTCGLTVISTYHSGIPELVKNGVSGFLAGENDIEGTADAILKIIDNPSLSVYLGENARRTIEDSFNLDKLNKKLENILSDIKLKC